MPRRGGGGRKSGGGGGGLFGFGGKKPAAPARPAARPAPRAAPSRAASTMPGAGLARRDAKPSALATPPAAAGGGMMSGIGSTIVQGMAFGTGSAIAHRAVGAVAGSMGGGGGGEGAPAPEGAPESSMAAPPPPMADCTFQLQTFNRCLAENDNDIAACQFDFNSLRDCQSM